MIKFFRQLRQKLLADHKFSKYLIYALGEIVLVVFGILIALSINNWNEERKERRIEQNYLKRLLVDLESDYTTLRFSKGLSQNRIDQIRILNDVIKDSSLSNKNSTLVIESIEKVTWRSYLPLSKIVYNELLNSGKMSLIQSEELRKLLSNYYADAGHWEMILNLEDAQKEFSHATAGLLSVEMLTAIENSSFLREPSPEIQIDIGWNQKDLDSIALEFSTKTDAVKWLPQIHHYHILAEKVITRLLTQNETLKKLVQSKLQN